MCVFVTDWLALVHMCYRTVIEGNRFIYHKNCSPEFIFFQAKTSNLYVIIHLAINIAIKRLEKAPKIHHVRIHLKMASWWNKALVEPRFCLSFTLAPLFEWINAITDKPDYNPYHSELIIFRNSFSRIYFDYFEQVDRKGLKLDSNIIK